MTHNNYIKGIGIAALGTFFFSTSPIFTLLIKGIPASEIAFLRIALASLFIFMFSRIKKESLSIKASDTKKFAVYGFITAMHFLFYVTSLFFTSIAHALSIVYMAPIFVTLFSAWFLKEHIHRYKYIGIGIVVMGVFVLTNFEPQMTPNMIVGDAMALISAVCYAIYSVVARRERQNYSLLCYTFWLYFWAAIFLLPFAVANFAVPKTLQSMASILLLGLLPTTLGHTLYNASIRYIHPTYSNLISTQEITGGILLGYLILGQVPSLNSIAGCLIMFIGLAIVLMDLSLLYRKYLYKQEN